MNLNGLVHHYLDKYPFLKQFIKFCIIGGISAVINFFILYTFTEFLQIWYLFSAIIGYIIAATFNFLSNKAWTFRHPAKGKEALRQLVKFLVVSVSGLITNTLIIYSVTEFIGFDYRLSWVFATGVITFWNFTLSRIWTFKHAQEQVTNLSSEEL